MPDPTTVVIGVIKEGKDGSFPSKDFNKEDKTYNNNLQ